MNSQAYPGSGSVADANSEYNRQAFMFAQMSNKMATCIPVKVVAVGDGRVDVQPMVNQLDGGGKAVPHGTINDVLVWQYQAGGAAVILEPVVGDKGLCIFAHSDISKVKATGDTANPGSRRKFDYSDGIYLGGLFGDAPEQYIKLSGAGVEIVSPTVSTSGNLSVGTGATGSLTDALGQVITVVDGIITGIS